MSLASITAQKIGGTAIAGFGLSLGRSTFLKMKNNLGPILLLGAAVLSIFMTYTCGVWLTRNYKTVVEGVAKKFGAVIILVPAFVISSIALGFIASGVFYLLNYLVGVDPSLLIPVYEGAISMYSLFLGESFFDDIEGTNFDIIFFSCSLFLSVFLFFVGLIKGYRDRSTRKKTWEAEIQNKEFLLKNGIEELDENHFMDSEGNRYRLE